MTVCQNCGKAPAVHKHHLFSNTKYARRLYGKLLDLPINIQNLCVECHLNQPVSKFSERMFCSALGIKPRSKTEQGRLLRKDAEKERIK